MQKKHVNCKYCANMEELLKTGTESLCDGTDYKLFLSGVEARKDPSNWLFFDVRLKLAAAKSLQSCPTLCDPIDGSPPGSPVPGILQARTLEWVAISFSNA